MRKLLLNMTPEDAELLRVRSISLPPDTQVDMIQECIETGIVKVRLGGKGLPCDLTTERARIAGATFPYYDYKIIMGDWPPVLKLIPPNTKKRGKV